MLYVVQSPLGSKTACLMGSGISDGKLSGSRAYRIEGLRIRCKALSVQRLGGT